MTRTQAGLLGLVGLLAPLLALLPPDGSAAPLGAGAAVATVSVGLGAWGVRGDHDLASRLAPFVYLIAIVLLRHAEGGATSGFSPMLLVPLAWVALREDRPALAALTVGIAVVLAAPIVAFGDPEYPASEWRRAAIWLAVAPVVGLAAQNLVADARRANEELSAQVRTDPLTGLLNRRGFAELAQRELGRARRTNEPLAIALIDLDHFKRFNDTYGHPAGDRVLTGAAAHWAAQLREIDVLARWGGEEFIVLLPRCPLPVAVNVLDRLREATPEGQTCSIGVAALDPREEIDTLTARADAALYEAKESGRNRVVGA